MEKHVYERMAALEQEHWWFVARRAIVGDVISRLPLPATGARILEAGCGTGGNLAMLSQFGRVSALEPDDDARAMARRKSGLDVREGALPHDIPFPRDHFDLVVALDVLEHVKEDGEALRALLARLKPGGHALITVPAFPFLWSRHDETHHHHRRYTMGRLRKTIEEAGGTALRVTHFNTLLFPLVAGVRLMQRATGLGGGNDDRMPAPAVNALLRAIFGSERWLLRHGNPLPGVSLLAVARRSATS